MRRLTLGMSQTTLAHAVGDSFQHVQRYEKGFNRLGSSPLQQIANTLQVPVTFFFEGAPGQSKGHDKAVPDFVAGFILIPDGLDLARAFMRLPKRLRRAVVRLVQDLAGHY